VLGALAVVLVLATPAALLSGCGEIGHSVPKVDRSPWEELGECRMELNGAGTDQMSSSVYSVSFADADHGWSTVLDQTGGVWQSSDGGASWALSEGRILGDRGQGDFSLPERVGQLRWPQRIVCVEDDTIWLAFKATADNNPESVDSQAGGILISRDGGATWRRCLVLDGAVGHEGIGGCSFTDAEHGWVSVVYGHGRKSEAYIYRTEDGGRSWQRRKYGGGDSMYEHMTGFIIDQTASWVPSTEEGLVWEPTGGSGSALRPTWPGQELAFGGDGWQSEYEDPYGLIVRSTDGGREWKRVLRVENTQPLRGVFFADERHGWIGGDGLILGTGDGGEGLGEDSWERELVLAGDDAVVFMHFCRAGDAIIAAGWTSSESEENGGVVRFYRRDLPEAAGEADESGESE